VSDKQDENQGEQPDNVVTLNTVHEMAEVIGKWHQHKVNVIKYIRDIPDGSHVELNGKPYVFTGDFREGVILGINLALNELGELPIVVESTDEVPPQNG
jgi:hypothetical protein